MSPTKFYKILPWIVPALFLVKASVLGMRIVGRWEVPDEEGHFAYARDLWTGKGARPLGEAVIDADIMTDVLERPAASTENWIVQHPPTYHLVAGAAWKAATYFTQDPDWLFRAPRLVSAIFGSLTLFFVYKTIHRMGLGSLAALASAAALSSLTPFSWLAAGTNHDTMVAALSMGSAFYFVEFMHARDLRSLRLSVFLGAVAAATKITALAVLVPLLAIGVLEVPAIGGRARWVREVAGVFAIALFVAGPWLMRSFVLYGDPLATATSVRAIPPAQSALGVSVLAYLRSHAVAEAFFNDLVGKIGVFDEVRGVHREELMPAVQRGIYGIILVFALGVACVRIVASILGGLRGGKPAADSATLLASVQQKVPPFIRRMWVGLLALTAVLALPFAAQVSTAAAMRWLAVPMVALAAMAGALSAAVFVLRIDRPRRLELHSWVILSFFSIAFLRQLYTRFIESGEMIAVGGRYAYAALGFAVSGLLGAALLNLRGWADRIAILAALIVCLIDAAFMFTQVIPYFAGSS